MGELPAAFQARIAQMGVPLWASVPYDAQLAEFDSSGRPLAELPPEALVSQAVEGMAQKLLASSPSVKD